jgi:hypothetical protein
MISISGSVAARAALSAAIPRFGAANPAGVVTTYTYNADPIPPRGVSGQRSFYLDQTGVIRYNQNAAAGPADLALQ